MDKDELIKQAERIRRLSQNENSGIAAYAEALEFIRVYAGERSGFYKRLLDANPAWGGKTMGGHASNVLEAFINYTANGLGEGGSLERKARNDVVSDLLGQAQALLDAPGIHPAAAAVLVGASLEEYLRTWVEDEALDLRNRKPGIDTYAVVLREADLISKQDHKDITSWAGLRNHAAHGEWDQVDDKKRVSIMLEGVNLFMRKYD